MQPLVARNAAADAAKKSPELGPGQRRFVPMQQALQQRNARNSPAEAAAESHPDHAAVNVQTIDKDGIVQKIIVTCRCGEVIEIDCDY